MKKTLLMVAALLAICSVKSFATSANLAGGYKSVARTIDASGYPVQFNDDKPWQVFENYGNVGVGGDFETQVTDARGNAPKSGILGKVCIESGTPGTSWVLVWDTSAQSTSGTVAAAQALQGRRLMPALYPATIYGVTCTPQLNALFTAGLRTVNEATSVISYIYWR